MESIRSGVEHTFSEPALEASKFADPDKKAVDNRMRDMKWKILFEKHKISVEDFKDNWVKAYALIWESYCSREVQMAVRELPDFETTVINQPLILLERVQILMHTQMKSK